MTTAHSTLFIAKEYVQCGFSVIPLKPRGKKPALLSWREFQERRPTEEELVAWFENGSRNNIGIITGAISGLAVLDADSPEAVEWCKTNLPQTPKVKTARGQHYYFKFRSKLKNSVNVNGLKLDVRGEGGYVVAPPSRHETGVIYSWVDGKGLDDLPLAEFPPELITGKGGLHVAVTETRGTIGKYGQTVLASELASLACAAEGTRNDTLNRAAFSLGTLVAGGELNRCPVEAALLATAVSTGLSDSEARRTIKSGMDSGAKEPRMAPKVDIRTEHGSTVVSVLRPPNEDWIEPVPLPDELLPVESFDYTLLPDSLRPWVKDICERIQCPPDFVAAGVIACVAAVLSRKVGIRPQANTDWTVIPNIWALVVGRPGVLKSPALEAALAPLKRLAAKAVEKHSLEDAEYRMEQMVLEMRSDVKKKEALGLLKKNSDADIKALLAVDEPDVPTLKRYIANDTSPASLGELLRQNPNGLLVHRDELVSLLKSLDREDMAEGRGFYLTAWNGDSSYTFDRIGRGLNLHIDAVCLSILGGTQPGRLTEYIGHAVRGGAADDGLIQRFGVLVWPDTNGTWKDVDREPNIKAKNIAFEVFEQLDSLNPVAIGAYQDTDVDGEPEGIPYLRLATDALVVFQEWRTDLEIRLRAGDLHPALEAHFGKYRKLVPALALIIHLANGESGPVTKKAMLKALAWGKYLETHALRAYGAISHSEVVVAKAILAKIRKGDLATSFSSRDVWRPRWSKLSDRNQVASGLRMLVDYGWLHEERLDTGGRPATIYHLNQPGESELSFSAKT